MTAAWAAFGTPRRPVRAGGDRRRHVPPRPVVPGATTWDREIGAIWPKSDVGARHPMRMVDLDADPMPEIALARPVRFTPTFVVARDGAEIGRIEGYPGQDFFWGLIERFVAQAKEAGGDAAG